jgi:hypothetical protein
MTIQKYKYMNKLLCWLLGHRWVFDSIMDEGRCTRCGKSAKEIFKKDNL